MWILYTKGLLSHLESDGGGGGMLSIFKKEAGKCLDCTYLWALAMQHDSAFSVPGQEL